MAKWLSVCLQTKWFWVQVQLLGYTTDYTEWFVFMSNASTNIQALHASSLGSFKYRFTKLYIGSDFMHYVIKCMKKGREIPSGSQLVKEPEALQSLTSEDAIQTV